MGIGDQKAPERDSLIPKCGQPDRTNPRGQGMTPGNRGGPWGTSEQPEHPQGSEHPHQEHLAQVGATARRKHREVTMAGSSWVKSTHKLLSALQMYPRHVLEPQGL